MTGVAIVFILMMVFLPSLKVIIATVGATIEWLLFASFTDFTIIEAGTTILSHNVDGNKLGGFLALLLFMVVVVGETGLFISVGQSMVRASSNGGMLATFLSALSSMLTAFADEATGISVNRKVGLSIARENGGEQIDKGVYRYILSLAVRFGNLVSGSTPVANPASIAVAFSFGLTLPQFVSNTWAPLGVAWVVGIILVLVRERGDLQRLEAAKETFFPAEVHGRRVLWGFFVLLLFVIGMASHSSIEHALHLEHNTLFLWVPAGGAILAAFLLYADPKMTLTNVLKHYFKDEMPVVITIWMITVMIATLETAGFIELVVESVQRIVPSGSAGMLTLALLVVVLGIVVTNLMDNVVAAILLSKLVLGLALPLGVQTNFAFLIAIVVTATSSFVSIGSIGGIMAQLALKEFKAGLTFPEWIDRYWLWTAITSLIAVGWFIIVIALG